jgi:hypothetical protein
MTRNRPTNVIAIALAVTVFAATWTLWGARHAEAVIAIIRTTGIFSVAQGQATNAHIVNTSDREERGFIINWTVLDSAGNTLAQSDRQTLEPGQSSSFEFRPTLTRGERLKIRFVLTVEGVNRNKTNFVDTQEIFNTGNGKTTVFLPYIEQ